MRIDHVVMALVDRHVDRLADGAARVVQERRQVRQLDEVAEVLDRPVAAPVVEVADERRAVGRREHGVRPADLDGVNRVPCHLREGRGSRRLHDLPGEAAREAHALAVDVGTRVPEQLQRLGRVAELDADLLEHGVGVLLDQREVLFREHLERRQRPGDVRDADRVRDGACGLARGTTAAAAATRGLGHTVLLSAGSEEAARRRCRPVCRDRRRGAAAE